MTNRSAYHAAPGGSSNGGFADGLAALGIVAGTSVTLRQRLLLSCCVDPACLRYRCTTAQGPGVCEGAARRNATYGCHQATDAMGRFGRDQALPLPLPLALSAQPLP